MVSATEPLRTIKVGVYNNSPKVFRDVDDKPAGVFIDILNYIAQKENWKLEYVYGQWDADLDKLKKGEIDIMPDVAISEARKRYYDFTNETVLDSWAVIYVRKDSTIGSLTDLEGKKVSILKSSVYEGRGGGIDQYLNGLGINATIVEVKDYRAALDYLEIGKVDAAVVGHIFSIANQKNYSNIKATKIFLKPTELRFALTKGSPDNPYLIQRLDYWVKNLKDGQDGFFNKTLEKYGLQELESQVPRSQPQREPIPIWVVKVVIVAFVAILLPWLMLVTILKRSGKKITDIIRGGL